MQKIRKEHVALGEGSAGYDTIKYQNCSLGPLSQMHVIYIRDFGYRILCGEGGRIPIELYKVTRSCQARTETYKYRGSDNKKTLPIQHTSCLAQTSLYAKPLINLEIFIFFFTNTSSVWINNTVKATSEHLQFG
ncbi:hypothetical protein ACFXTI_015977 [Malus domestica]